MNMLSRDTPGVLSYTRSLWKTQVVNSTIGFSKDDSSSQRSTRTVSTFSSASTSSSDGTATPTVPCHVTTRTTTTTTPNRKPTLNEFRILLKLWKHGMLSGDAEWVANRYAPNAILTNNDCVPLKGRKAIRAYYEKQFFTIHQPKDIKVLHGDVSIFGEQVHDNGVYDITTQSGRLLRMKYTFVYSRDNDDCGRWKIVHHKTSPVCEVSLSETPIDNHAQHFRTVQLEVEEEEDNYARHVRTFLPEDEEDMELSSSSIVVPWGDFPFEDGLDLISNEDTTAAEAAQEQQQLQQVEKDIIARQPCHINSQPVSPVTGEDISEKYNDTLPKLPIRRQSDDLPAKEVIDVWNNTKKSISGKYTDTPPQLPKRRPSEIDRLVCLLTGSKSVDPNKTILLSVDNNDRTIITSNRRPSQVDHLVGLLTGTKAVTQKDLILLSVADDLPRIRAQ